jgi:hypothetical protein
LRYDLPELGQDGGSLSERHGDIEFVKTTLQRRPGEPYTFRTGYLCTGAWQNPLVGIEELFEEFFARAEANELEFLAGFAGEANQSFRQFRDPNRFPMSSTRMSPCLPIAKACNTRLTASEMVMKKRVISG